MAKDYSKLEKDDLLKVIEKPESRKKYGLIWDEEKTKEKFGFIRDTSHLLQYWDTSNLQRNWDVSRISSPDSARLRFSILRMRETAKRPARTPPR